MILKKILFVLPIALLVVVQSYAQQKIELMKPGKPVGKAEVTIKEEAYQKFSRYESATQKSITRPANVK